MNPQTIIIMPLLCLYSQHYITITPPTHFKENITHLLLFTCLSVTLTTLPLLVIIDARLKHEQGGMGLVLLSSSFWWKWQYSFWIWRSYVSIYHSNCCGIGDIDYLSSTKELDIVSADTRISKGGLISREKKLSLKSVTGLIGSFLQHCCLR